MDFADTLLNHFENEAEMKRPYNALICFNSLETGKKMCRLTIHSIRSKSEKTSITLLYFIDKENEDLLSAKKDEYPQKILEDFIPSLEKDKITLRLFVQPLDNIQEEIRRISEEQKSNLVLLGIHRNTYFPELVKKYSSFKNNPANSDSFIQEQFDTKEAETLKNVNALFFNNTVSTGLFLDGGVTGFRKIFVPILHQTDIYLFTYLYRIAQQENMKIMIWDAIGIFQSNPKMQKLFQFIAKKTDGHFYLWDNDKKIGNDFIKEQDLVITGMEGWGKLISTPLSWIDNLPSIMIIKEKTNPL